MTQRLLVINYSLDSSDTIFGHQAEISLRLLEKFEHIAVISAFGGKNPLRDTQGNQITHFTINWTENRNFRNVTLSYFSLLKCLLFFRPQLVFFHMTDTLAALFSPILFFLGIPQVLWYAHTTKSLALRFSMFFMKTLVSSTPGSFPEKVNHLKFIGQSINHELFPFTPRNLREPIKAVCFGRFDPSKKIHEVINACLSINDFDSLFESLTIIGTPSNIDANNYKNSIEKQFDNLILSGKLVLKPSVPRYNLAAETQRFNLFIHAFTGSLDKVLLEATFLGLPVVTANQEYIKEFGSWSYLGANLEEELSEYLNTSLSSRTSEVIKRYSAAANNHSLEKWVEKLTCVLEGK